MTVIMSCHCAIWKFVVKKATFRLFALRTIFVEEPHFATAVLTLCVYFYVDGDAVDVDFNCAAGQEAAQSAFKG